MKWTSLTQVIPRQFSRIVGWLVLALTPGILQGSIDLNRLVPADSPAEYVEWVRALEFRIVPGIRSTTFSRAIPVSGNSWTGAC